MTVFYKINSTINLKIRGFFAPNHKNNGILYKKIKQKTINCIFIFLPFLLQTKNVFCDSESYVTSLLPTVNNSMDVFMLGMYFCIGYKTVESCYNLPYWYNCLIKNLPKPIFNSLEKFAPEHVYSQLMSKKKYIYLYRLLYTNNKNNIEINESLAKFSISLRTLKTDVARLCFFFHQRGGPSSSQGLMLRKFDDLILAYEKICEYIRIDQASLMSGPNNENITMSEQSTQTEYYFGYSICNVLSKTYQAKNDIEITDVESVVSENFSDNSSDESPDENSPNIIIPASPLSTFPNLLFAILGPLTIGVVISLPTIINLVSVAFGDVHVFNNFQSIENLINYLPSGLKNYFQITPVSTTLGLDASNLQDSNSIKLLGGVILVGGITALGYFMYSQI